MGFGAGEPRQEIIAPGITAAGVQSDSCDLPLPGLIQKMWILTNRCAPRAVQARPAQYSTAVRLHAAASSAPAAPSRRLAAAPPPTPQPTLLPRPPPAPTCSQAVSGKLGDLKVLGVRIRRADNTDCTMPRGTLTTLPWDEATEVPVESGVPVRDPAAGRPQGGETAAVACRTHHAPPALAPGGVCRACSCLPCPPISLQVGVAAATAPGVITSLSLVFLGELDSMLFEPKYDM